MAYPPAPKLVRLKLRRSLSLGVARLSTHRCGRDALALATFALALHLLTRRARRPLSQAGRVVRVRAGSAGDHRISVPIGRIRRRRFGDGIHPEGCNGM